jgi:hypothetical protein
VREDHGPSGIDTGGEVISDHAVEFLFQASVLRCFGY